MLRDVLTSLPGLGTWPCDEINYIWRRGNARHTTDEFTPQMARPEVKTAIRRAFDRLAKRRDVRCVVEKTCANSLRVSFVDSVVPRARFIHIVRDGRDVAASAAERWAAPLEIRYLLKKARFVPLRDLPYYGARYLLNRLHRITSSKRRVASWGPRFSGMNEVLRTSPLPVACALQWRRCVERAMADLAKIDPARVFELRYEQFVESPDEQLRGLVEFMQLDVPAAAIRGAVENVSAKSVGRWQHTLDADVIEQIHLLCGDLLRRLGYRRADVARAA